MRFQKQIGTEKHSINERRATKNHGSDDWDKNISYPA
jgi:hypothetical protein